MNFPVAILLTAMVQLCASSPGVTITTVDDASWTDLPSTTEMAATENNFQDSISTEAAVVANDFHADSEDFTEDTYPSNEALGDSLPRWEARRLRRVRRDSIVVRPLEVTRSRGPLATRQKDARKKRKQPGATQQRAPGGKKSHQP